MLTTAIVRADASNHLLSDALGSNAKGKLSLVGYSVAIVTPFLGQPGVIVSGLMLAAVALMWLIPDRRIEAALERDQPAG